MKYLTDKFSSPANSRAYIDGWEATFGEKRIYPCDTCLTMRTLEEGGTVFTVCDSCWAKIYPRK